MTESGTAGRLARIRRELRTLFDPVRAAFCQRFFKTAKGEYGEGDVFAGVTVPQIRTLVRRFHPVPFQLLPALIGSRFHEERLLGLLLLVERYRTGTPEERRIAFDLYLKSVPHINNWDLVDATAEHVVGPHRVGRARLLGWAASDNLWLRRIAIVSTFHSIRRGRFSLTLAIAGRLLRDEEDLIHKAVGWMLREVGKRSASDLEAFLLRHHRTMPRTMLRYAIERFPKPRQRAYLAGIPRGR